MQYKKKGREKKYMQDYNRKYYIMNKEREKERALEYYYDNRDEINESKKEYTKQYYLDNKEDIKNKVKGYYQNHRNEKLDYAKDYRQNNMEKINEYQREYRQSENGRQSKRKSQNKRKRELGYIKLWDNPFPEEIEVDYHHINNFFVIPIPRISHNKSHHMDREQHRESCNVKLNYLYGFNINEILEV